MNRFIPILLLAIPFKAYAQKDSVDFWISKINNRSIAGQCNYAWVLGPIRPEVNKLIKAGSPAEKELLNLITDERKGVIAHYILSNIHGENTYAILAMDSITGVTIYSYNDLQFTEHSYGMEADKLSLEMCKRQWAKKLKK